jgi:hypothetical protein
MLSCELIVVILIILILYLISNKPFNSSNLEQFQTTCPIGLRNDGINCWEDKKMEPIRWESCCSKMRIPPIFGRPARTVCVGCFRGGGTTGCGCIKQRAMPTPNLTPPNLTPPNLTPPNLTPPNLTPNFIPSNLTPNFITSNLTPSNLTPNFIPSNLTPSNITPNLTPNSIPSNLTPSNFY